MAQRKQQRTRSAAAVAPERATRRPAAERRTADTLETLKSERDELKRQLEAAHQRIAALEKQKEDAVNRIDWVIDSLNTLLDSDA